MIKKIINKVAKKAGYVPAKSVNVWDERKGHLRQFQLHSSEKEWRQMMMYNEMMYKLRDVPGDLAEFGVAAGVSFISFMRTVRILEQNHGRDQRGIYGFDSFEGLPELAAKDATTTGTDTAPEMKPGGYYQGDTALTELKTMVDKDPNTKLIAGWFDTTVPEFFNANPHVSLAFVHLDADLYESTKVVLEHTWERLVPGGIVLFDELNKADFPGETVAYREFFENKVDAYSIHSTVALPGKRYLVKK